jgi:hypothetical protein
MIINYPHGKYNKPNEMNQKIFDEYIKEKIDKRNKEKKDAKNNKDLIKEASDRLDALNFLVKKLNICKKDPNSKYYNVPECKINSATADKKYNIEVEKKQKEKEENRRRQNMTNEEKAIEYLSRPIRRR